MLDTGLFTGHQTMTDAWMAFRDFVERTEDLPVGLLVAARCMNDPGDEVIAGYERAVPERRVEGGRPRVPADPADLARDARAARPASACSTALRADPRPKLFLWADSDPVLPLETGRRFAAALGGEIDHVIAGASPLPPGGRRPGDRGLDRRLAAVRAGARAGLDLAGSAVGDYAASRARSSGDRAPETAGPSNIWAIRAS